MSDSLEPAPALTVAEAATRLWRYVARHTLALDEVMEVPTQGQVSVVSAPEVRTDTDADPDTSLVVRWLVLHDDQQPWAVLGLPHELFEQMNIEPDEREPVLLALVAQWFSPYLGPLQALFGASRLQIRLLPASASDARKQVDSPPLELLITHRRIVRAPLRLSQAMAPSVWQKIQQQGGPRTGRPTATAVYGHRVRLSPSGLRGLRRGDVLLLDPDDALHADTQATVFKALPACAGWAAWGRVRLSDGHVLQRLPPTSLQAGQRSGAGLGIDLHVCLGETTLRLRQRSGAAAALAPLELSPHTPTDEAQLRLGSRCIGTVRRTRVAGRPGFELIADPQVA